MTRATSKAARLLLLYLLRESGALGDEVRNADVARWLGVNRSTVGKDLRVLDEVLTAWRKLQATQPWVRRFYSTSETAEALGIDYDTALAMIAGGLIVGQRDGERGLWRVPVAEVERWKEKLRE